MKFTNRLKLGNFQKTRLVLIINFFLVLGLIIFIPFLVKGNYSFILEETAESFFLFLGMLALIFIFLSYEKEMEKQKDYSFWLNLELAEKEKELLKSFEHLGKINVQVAMIKSLFNLLSIPEGKKDLEMKISELLRMACSFSHKDFTIILVKRRNYLKNSSKKEIIFKMLESSPHCSNQNLKKEKQKKELLKYSQEFLENRKKLFEKEDFFIFSSNSSFGQKVNNPFQVFLLLPKINKEENFSSEKKNFLQIIATECEIIYLLFIIKERRLI